MPSVQCLICVPTDFVNLKIVRMNVSKKLSCEQARQMDMVDYLAGLGYHPAKIRNDDYWYCSPLRNERTPSFKINRKKNVWYDHGTGEGGNLLDFGVLYHHCSVGELLEKLDGNLSFHRPVTQTEIAPEPAIKILSQKQIGSLSLLRYLRQRRIAEDVAKQYCLEVSFEMRGKLYNAIGFQNNAGGTELRSPWFKGGIAPKEITTLEKGAKELIVFEGFFDFLSYQSIERKNPLPSANFLVLNSTSFFEKSRQFMERHKRVHLFLDQDKTGKKFTETAMSWSQKYVDESHLYKGYKDLNEWMQQIGKSMK
jgi:DNA primase